MIRNQNAERSGNILLVSPHPDDEIIGAGATAMLLHKAGNRVINLACGLGKPEQYDRRRAELEDACQKAGFEVVVPEHPALISSKDDMDVAQKYISGLVTDLYEQYRPDVVIAPSVHDAHHGHEVVARGVRDSLSKIDGSRMWMWNIWGELPYSNIYSPFDQPVYDRVITALDAYKGENERNDYRKMVLGRATLNTALGSEKVFGFGATAASEQPYADLLTEVIRSNDKWVEGKTRILDSENAFVPNDSGKSLDEWMNSISPRQQYLDQQ